MNNKYIAISFTLKNQDINDILKVVEKIASENPDACLISGFMPVDVVKKKKFDPLVADTLQKLFPVKLDFYDREKDAPARKAMMETVASNRAKVYIIGRIVDGVAEEFELYKKVLPSENIVLLDCNDYQKNPHICKACRGDGRRMDSGGYLNSTCPDCKGSGQV